jgi:hypothetical protein
MTNEAWDMLHLAAHSADVLHEPTFPTELEEDAAPEPPVATWPEPIETTDAGDDAESLTSAEPIDLDDGTWSEDLLDGRMSAEYVAMLRIIGQVADKYRGRGLTLDELEAFVRLAWERQGHDPALPDAEIKALVAEAVGKVGNFAPELSDFIVNVERYAAGVPATIPWLCMPVAYSGGVSLIAGPAKGGKSTLAADLQRCRETGEKLFGVWDVQTGPTLLITEEGGVAVVHKTDGLHALDILDRRAALEGGLTFTQLLGVVRRWSEIHAGGLVFIDTLAIWAGIEDENDAAKVTAALGAVMALAQSTGLAIVLVHHTRKGGGEHGEAIRGSGAMLATVDIALELTRTGDERYPDERYLAVQGRVVLEERHRLGFDRLTKKYFMVDLAERIESETDGDLAGVPADGPGLTRDDLHSLWGKDPRKLLDRYLRAGRLRVEMVKDGRVHALRYWRLPPRSLWADEP